MKPILNNKHVWKKNSEGEPDIYAYFQGYHNGPICEICGKSACIHCDNDYEDQECREKHFTCGNCAHILIEEDNYCSQCGTEIYW